MNDTRWAHAWNIAGWTMLHYVWLGAMLGAFAAAGRRLLRRSHPDIRYAYALLSLATLGIAPVVIAYEISHGVLPRGAGPRVATELVPASATPVTFARQPARADVADSLSRRPTANVDGQPTPVHATATALESIISFTSAVATALPGIWLVGAPLTFAYLALGLIGADRLWRRSRPVPNDELVRLCNRLAILLGVARRITVGVCDQVAAPLLLGIVRPLILVPPAALAGWSPEQVEMALLHELAHVRRWDNLVNLIQRIVEAALFFQPAVWVVSGWARREREHCCDRIVAASTGRAFEYAQALFALTESTSAAMIHAAYMARPRNHLVDRVRLILNPEDHTMRLSQITVSLATALLFVPVVLAAGFVRTANPDPRAPQAKASNSAKPAVVDSPRPSPPAQSDTVANRQLRSGLMKASRRMNKDGAPWQPGPIPATINVDVSGMAKDESGKSIPGATITVYSITEKGSQPAGTATTDARGFYSIKGAILPVWSSNRGHPLPKEITPYADFILTGVAPDFGIAWSPQHGMQALKEPNPDDIQGRLPLGQPVTIDLVFPKAAALEGKVVDEEGQPVEGAKLQVGNGDLLDAAGHETNNLQGYDWKALPGNIGRAVTGREGRFRLAGLADRACFWISVTRPETDNTDMGFYAATIPGPDTVHEQLPPQSFNGRGRHEVKSSPITIKFPKIRPIAVTVVGDDTGKPIAGAGVFTLSDSLATGVRSGGTTDASGKVLLGLPPGRYKGICCDPPIETNYIRTYQRPLLVERGEGPQPYELRQKPGTELIFQAVGPRDDQPVAGAYFWKAPEDQPEATQYIETSTFVSGEPWTSTKGEFRAVLPPEPGRRYHFRFAGIHEANMPPWINPETADKQGYEAFPTQSAPVELIPGKTIRLRFVLYKRG